MIRVSDNRRFLVRDDGSPFFYLADTAWELFHRLDREKATLYLTDRAAKGFTAIQAVALAGLDGLHTPNPYGHTPLHYDDPTRPNEADFEHVDFIVDTCNRLGMAMALLPTWGDKWNRKWGAGPEIFTPENAKAYGRWLGERYRDREIIWVVGGDGPVETDAHRAIVRAMAEGLRAGDGGRGLITLHPSGAVSSSRFVHDEPWLNFNMMQSGHSLRYNPNWRMLRADYEREPTKPTLDGEPCYENHPIAFNRANPPFNDHDVRCAAYWAVFAGACGHTYGCHDIWMMREPAWQLPTATGYWHESIGLPRAAQMGHLRRLMESRPYLTRIPDWRATEAASTHESDHVQVTRDGTPDGRDATYVMAYTPIARRGWSRVDTSAIARDRLRVWLFDPRNGRAHLAAECANAGSIAWPEVADGPDWVCVVDDADAGYPPPGTKPAAA